jgi:hypothetical protein
LAVVALEKKIEDKNGEEIRKKSREEKEFLV